MTAKYPEPHTITLDDDEMIPRIIENASKIKSVGFTDPGELLASLERFNPVGIFVDIHLGVRDSGLDVIPNLREAFPFCPILIVTGSPTEQAISKALNCGADDFVRKPLIPDEVNARLKLRMADAAQKSAKTVVDFGDLTIDTAHRTVEGPYGKRFASPIEISLLATLANTEGNIVEKDALKMRCWGQIKVTDNALHRKLHAVRQLLKDLTSSVTIETKYGVGFALKYEGQIDMEAAS